MPLAVGNTWYYQTIVRDTSGKIISKNFDTTTIESSFDYNGNTLYRIRLPQLAFFPRSDAFINKTDGLWLWRTGEALFIYDLYIPFPVSLNNGTESVKLVNSDTVINSPAGTFHTLKYHVGEIGDGPGDFYYAVGIGLVYQDNFIGQKVLLDYKIR